MRMNYPCSYLLNLTYTGLHLNLTFCPEYYSLIYYILNYGEGMNFYVSCEHKTVGREFYMRASPNANIEKVWCVYRFLDF